MKKMIGIFSLLCLVWSCGMFTARADNPIPNHWRCICAGPAYGGNQQAPVLPPDYNPLVFETEDLSDDEEDYEEYYEDESALNDNFATQLEVRLLRRVLNDMAQHTEAFANNNLEDALLQRYQQAAEGIEVDFQALRRGANYGYFMEDLRAEIDNRLTALDAQEATVEASDNDQLSENQLNAVETLILTLRDRQEQMMHQPDSRTLRLRHLIYNRMLFHLYRISAENANSELTRSNMQGHMRTQFENGIENVLLVLDAFQYTLEMRIHLWVNRLVLHYAENSILEELNALEGSPINTLGGYQALFQQMNGQGDFNDYRTRVDYGNIRRDLHIYADGLRQQMGIPSWTVFGLTQEEMTGNVELIRQALRSSSAVYLTAQNLMHGNDLVYLRRLFVRASLSFFCQHLGLEDAKNQWERGARQDLVRLLDDYPSFRLVPLHTLPPGIHQLPGGGTINIAIMPSKNGTHEAHR